MTTFAYVALEPNGRRKTGYVDAADKRSAIALVAAEGRHVLEIKEEEKKTRSSAESVQADKRSRTNKSDVALFTRRLSDLSGAGLPLDRVLQVLSEQSESEQLSQVAMQALDDVKKGLPVSQALAKFPKLFPEMYTQTLSAGEASGQFPEAAERLADLQESEVARRSLIVSALIYPMVLTFVAIGVVVFLLTFVVPRLSGIFEGMGDDLPAPTKMLLGLADFLTSNWIVIVTSLVIFLVAGKIWLTTKQGIEVRDAALLKIPSLGKIVKKAIVSRYSRVLGTLIYGGVPILEAISLAGLASGNTVFAKANLAVEADVREGHTIAGALRDSGEFPPVLTHMVAVGEETGDLPKMLGRVSRSLDFEVEQGLQRATAFAEPIIILVLGAIVAFVVLAVLLPIFAAQELIK